METALYPTLEQAWAAAAGTAPLPCDLLPPAKEWFVASHDIGADSPAWPAPLGRILPRRTLRTFRTAVLSPSACEIPPFLDAPAQLPPGSALILGARGEASSRQETRLAFNYHWIREVAAGIFQGDIGLAVDGGVNAAVDTTLSGEFLTVLVREPAGGVRLRIARNAPAAVSASAGIKVGAQLNSRLAIEAGGLVRTLLGVSDAAWFEALTGEYGRWLAQNLHISFDTLEKTLNAFRALDPAFAAALWQAFQDPASLRSVRHWLPRIAAMDNAVQFQNAIIEADSAAACGTKRTGITPFRGSAAEQCVEAAGAVSAVLTSQDAWTKLRSAAAGAEPLCTDGVLARTLRRLRAYATYEFASKRLARAAHFSNASVDPWMLERIRASLGNGGNLRAYRSAAGFAGRLYEAARSALASKICAALSWQAEHAWAGHALVDAAFDSPEHALDAYRFALAGDLGGVIERAGRLHEALLTHGISSQSRLEVRLPLLAAREWSGAWQALASARIEATEDGRINVYTVAASDRVEKDRTQQSALVLAGALARRAGKDELRATFTDTRRLPRDKARLRLAPLVKAYGFPAAALDWIDSSQAPEIEAVLTLDAPKDAASAWLQAPKDRDPQFFPVWSAVSIALQQAMRRWLPYAWFSDLHRYEDLGAAWPLLVYQCTRPYPCKPPAEFTYDIMEAGKLKIARQTTARALNGELRRAGALLLAAGRTRAARFYLEVRPQAVIDAVERQPLNFNGLIQADTTFVNAVVDLARKGWQVCALRDTDPEQAARELAGFAADFTHQFHRRLRRLYAGASFPAFGTLLLVEAARALGAAVGTDAGPAGTLRLTAGNATRIFRTEPVAPDPALAA